MITLDEAKAIINRTDPRHVKYYANDPGIVREVNEAFARQYPGEIDLGND